MMPVRMLVSVCLLGAVVAACGADDVAFTDPGTVFEVDPDDDFVIVLQSNATTGFAWQLETDLPGDVVRLVRDVYVEPDTDLVGAAGRQEFTFEGVGDGAALIRLWYVRSFDDPPEPADRAEFEVIVGTGSSG